jgi:hypothetical protein
LNGDPERGWIPMLIIGVFLVVAAAPARRASWAVYGVLGLYASALHYLSQELGARQWSFALAAIGVALAIFALGTAQHLYGQALAQRFVRRPPPELSR